MAIISLCVVRRPSDIHPRMLLPDPKYFPVCLTPLQLLQLFVMNCSCDQIQIVVANVVDPFEQLLFRSNVNES